MQARAVRVLLALLILMQSVSTFAAVSVPAAPSPNPAHFLNMDRSSDIPTEMRAASTPCHGDSDTPASQAAENCCDSMEYVDCMLACYPMATAISSGPDLDGSPVHVRYKVDQVYSSPQEIPSGLFRPPRSS